MSAWTDAIDALNPYSWYKCDEAAGTTLVDSGDAPLNGVTAATNVTHNQPSLVPGDPAGKSKFTTLGGQIDTGSFVTSRAVNGWTMMGAYKGTPANIAGTGRIFNGGGVQINAGAVNIELRVFGSDTTIRSLGTRDFMLSDKKIFWCLVCKVLDIRFYLGDEDGVFSLRGAHSFDPAADPTGTALFRFARGGGTDYLGGYYSNLIFVDGALTEEVIEDTYTLGFLGEAPPPVSASGSLIEIARAKAKAFLGLANIENIGSNSLLHQYWRTKSGLANPLTRSIQDHVIAAGKKHWIKDVE